MNEMELKHTKIKYIAIRLIKAILLILVIISLNFFLVHFMPGDPLIHILGEEEYFSLSMNYPDILEEVRAQYSLNGNIFEQYIRYLINTLTLKFGTSFITGESAVTRVFFRMKWTLFLSIIAIFLSAIIGGFLGVVAGYHKGGKFDSILTAISLFLETVPTNCLALIFLVVFAFKLRWFPVGGMTSGGTDGINKLIDIMNHMILPLSVLVIFKTSSNFLLMKSFVSQIRNDDYILVALSKGLSKSKVLFRHVLINVMVPYITVLCIQFGHIFSGAMMVEVVFSWKGMGTLIYESVIKKDYPTVQLCFLIITICVILFNFIADVLCAYIDNRIGDSMRNE